MGRRCIACGHERANERFGGKGMRRVICDTCRKLPKQELFDRLGTDECWGFLSQKNISEKNILRLKELETRGGERLQNLARVVREIALVCPRPKKRWLNLRLKHPELYHRATELDLCEDDNDNGWPFDTWICPNAHDEDDGN